MSVAGITNEIGQAGGPPGGQVTLSPEELARKQKDLAAHKVRWWKKRIDSASKLKIYEDQKKWKEAAKQFYQGKFFSDKEKGDWEGDTVQANLFVRTVNFLVDAVYSQNPRIRVHTRKKIAPPAQPPASGMGGPMGMAPNQMGMGSPPMGGQPPIPPMEKVTEILENQLTYIFEECDLKSEIRRTWKDSYFGNLSAAKLDFDRSRGVWRIKWIPNQLICDPDAHGDLSRARWVAEKIVMPRYRVWQEESFDQAAREKLRLKIQQDPSYADTDEEKRAENETLWYVYSQEGDDPLQGSKGSRLMVFCESVQEWLLDQENPFPFIDNDEYIISILRLDEVPGEFIGPPLWKLIEAVIVSFNWAASYHMSDMRKTASRKIAYDKNAVDDPALLDSRKHGIKIPIDTGQTGDVTKRVAVMDMGQSDKTIFDSVAFFRDMLDRLTGIDEIARGEEGKVKTATESQILQQNSNIALRGPSQALDNFLNDVIRKLALATLYYTPAFSINEVQPGIFMTRQVMQTVVPVPDMMTGQIVLQPQTQIVEVPSNGPATHGIDYFQGDEAAIIWSQSIGQMPPDQFKCELSFSVEAGSTRAERPMEKQRQVTEIMNVLGQELTMGGFFGQKWELLNTYLDAFEVPDRTKYLPTKDEYIAGSQMAQMAMMSAGTGAPPGGGKGNPKSFERGNSATAGVDFPMDRSKGDQSSGGGQ